MRAMKAAWVVPFLILVAGCVPGLVNRDYLVCIAGTEGITYSGNYGVVRADGSSWSKSIEGVVVAQGTCYRVQGTIVSAVVQKKTVKGQLTLSLWEGAEPAKAKLVRTASTEAEYGLVTVAGGE